MNHKANLQKTTGYVYTIKTVRNRLNRGAKFVYLFLPNCNDLFKCTKKNLKTAIKTFNRTSQCGCKALKK